MAGKLFGAEFYRWNVYSLIKNVQRRKNFTSNTNEFYQQNKNFSSSSRLQSCMKRSTKWNGPSKTTEEKKTEENLSFTWNQIEFVRDLSVYCSWNWTFPLYIVAVRVRLWLCLCVKSMRGDFFWWLFFSSFEINMKYMNSITSRNKFPFSRCGILWSKSMNYCNEPMSM